MALRRAADRQTSVHGVRVVSFSRVGGWEEKPLMSSDGVSNPARQCDCDPDRDVFCDEAGQLTILIRRGEKISHQYDDILPFNLAVGDLADHLRVDRASVLAALSKHPVKSVRSYTRVP